MNKPKISLKQAGKNAVAVLGKKSALRQTYTRFATKCVNRGKLLDRAVELGRTLAKAYDMATQKRTTPQTMRQTQNDGR